MHKRILWLGVLDHSGLMSSLKVKMIAPFVKMGKSVNMSQTLYLSGPIMDPTASMAMISDGYDQRHDLVRC